MIYMKRFSFVISGGIILLACIGIILFFRMSVAYPSLEEHSIHKDNDLIIGSFDVKVDLYLNEYTSVRYAIPIDVNTNKPVPSADNILFYAPYNGEAPILSNGFPKHILEMARRRKCSVFTLVIKTDTISTSERDKYYVYNESGWHDIIFAIHRHICECYGFKPRKIKIFGESSGGSLAQNLLVNYPHLVDKAAWNGGCRYANFKQNVSYPSFLACSIWGCYGQEITREMCIDARKMNIQADFINMPPEWRGSFANMDHHAAWNAIYLTTEAFLFDEDWQNSFSFFIPDSFMTEPLFCAPKPQDQKGSIIFCRPINETNPEKEFWRELLWGAYSQGFYAILLNYTELDRSILRNALCFNDNESMNLKPLIVICPEDANDIDEGETGLYNLHKMPFAHWKDFVEKLSSGTSDLQ